MRHDEPGLETFDRYRPLLFSIAYRMLGGVMEAEDVVQEAYLRWRSASGEGVRSPKAYLSRVVTRLSIDRLRREKARREEYVGPWLPEPLVEETEPAGLMDALSTAFLILLESLGPVERAVFLLRDVFGYEYGEIAALVGKSEANCRQICRRARASIAARRPRFESSPEDEERLLRGFLKACTEGDMDDLVSMLSEDVTLYSDGGGKARAARNPIHGAEKVARFFAGILSKAPPEFLVRRATVNGRPGLIGYFGDGRPHSVTTLDVVGGSIRAVHLVVNPDKLRGIRPLERDEREVSG